MYNVLLFPLLDPFSGFEFKRLVPSNNNELILTLFTHTSICKHVLAPENINMLLRTYSLSFNCQVIFPVTVLLEKTNAMKRRFTKIWRDRIFVEKVVIEIVKIVSGNENDLSFQILVQKYSN